jgi:hypothetical protein
MASEQLFRFPRLAKLIKALGAFPKKKFVRDQASLDQVLELYNSSQVIMIFPEGRRTWDGRAFPIRPGIGKLIKKIDARVVCCQIHTGHLWQPRWAKWPRWVPIEITFLPPQQFSSEWSVEQITQWIQEQITIDPAPVPQGRLVAFRAAEGLETILWACPSCLALGTLKVVGSRRSHIACSSCLASWMVSPTNTLIDAKGHQPDLHLIEARERLADHFGTPPIANSDSYAVNGIVLESINVRISAISGSDGSSVLGVGILRLFEDRLELSSDDTVIWKLSLSDCRAVAMEMGNILQLRTQDSLIQLDPSEDSTAMWAYFVKHWHLRTKERR